MTDSHQSKHGKAPECKRNIRITHCLFNIEQKSVSISSVWTYINNKKEWCKEMIGSIKLQRTRILVDMSTLCQITSEHFVELDDKAKMTSQVRQSKRESTAFLNYSSDSILPAISLSDNVVFYLTLIK